MDIQQFNDHVEGFAQSNLSRSELIGNFTLGLAGESGEVADLVKKHLFHGDPIDQDKLIKEMGDILWYWFALLQLFDITPEEVMMANVEKLQKRHEGKTFNREIQRINKATENE